MKKLILLLLLPFIQSCYEKQCNCNDYKIGKFKFDYVVNGVKKTTLFERTDKLQIETYEGKTDTASIRWVNDCEFVLQKINPKNMQERKAIQMKILTTSKKSYTFEFGIVGTENKQKGTVQKIN